MTLRDGDLHAIGRYSNTPTPPWEHESRRWMMHSGRHSDISPEQWHAGNYNWSDGRLDLADGQYIDIQVPRIMVVAIWQPELKASNDTKPVPEGAYTMPYLDFMRRAIAELGITIGSQPKKETVMAWFRDQTIEQRPLSENFARHLATFVRLPEAQRGDNRKWRMAG